MKYDASAIQTLLKKYPRKELSVAPTPIYKLSRISSFFGRNIYIMREDMTGFAIGGNKIRKLEFLIGQALAKGADTLVTTYASSFSRNAAAAGAAFNFDVHVVVAGEEAEQNPASQALFEQTGAHLYYTSKTAPDAVETRCAELIQTLTDNGKTVIELHRGGSDEFGTLGYINAFDQIVEFSRRANVHFDKIIHATGSTATQAGLILGGRISGYDARIVGIATSQGADVQFKRVRDLTRATARMLDVDFEDSDVVIDDRFLGPGYAVASDGGEKAARMFAAMEGVLLDQTYTAKAAAAIISYAANAEISETENILFVHTGGNWGLFY